MSLLDTIPNLIKNLEMQSNNCGCFVMHPSTAEDLLAYYLGVKVAIVHVCPKDRVYLVKNEDIARNLWKPEDSV